MQPYPPLTLSHTEDGPGYAGDTVSLFLRDIGDPDPREAICKLHWGLAFPSVVCIRPWPFLCLGLVPCAPLRLPSSLSWQ